MRSLRFGGICLALLLATPALSHADNLLPADRAIEQAIDHYIDARLAEDKLKAAAQADDANFVRRVTLDLNGRIPTPAEVEGYVSSTDPGKRLKLVERLLASPAFARYQAVEFDTMLMSGTNGSVRDYLLRALAENRPWDRIYRDLMLPDDEAADKKGASGFLRPRLNDIDKLANDVSVVFFGVNIGCARCHDHPLVPDWKQDHFFGLRAFLGRTFDAGGLVAERGYGPLKFKTVKNVEKQAQFMFLTGKVVTAPDNKEPSAEEQKKEKAALEEYKKQKKAPPPPAWSARAQLVEVSLQADQQHFFARSIVNRLWQRLFAQGLVSPVDQMHAENPASHPELLDWLARDLAAHKYDLKRLLKGLVLSKTYSRGSRWEHDGPVPRPAAFAVARVRALTPMQLAVSLRLATSDPAALARDTEKKIEEAERSAGGFARLIEEPGDDFQISVSEALLFSNSDRVLKDYLSDANLAWLKEIKEPREALQRLFKTVFGRPPRPEELSAVLEYYNRRADRPVEAYRQIAWALLTSAEFRFNY